MTLDVADLLGMDTLKTCSLCGQDKPLTSYYLRDGKPRARCKTCCQPPRTAELRAKEAAWARRRRAENGGADGSILARHGVSARWYISKLADQAGGCAICSKSPEENGKALAIDHDHRHCPGPVGCWECVRGLLCSTCNTGIGYLGDDHGTVQSAADYLRRSHRDPSC